MKTFTAPDGIVWGVGIQSPGASSSLIMFRHPDGRSSRLDRYNWVINQGPDARSVTARLEPKLVLESLSDNAIKQLFGRSMPVSRQDPLTNAPEHTQG